MERYDYWTAVIEDIRTFIALHPEIDLTNYATAWCDIFAGAERDVCNACDTEEEAENCLRGNDLLVIEAGAEKETPLVQDYAIRYCYFSDNAIDYVLDDLCKQAV